MVSAPAGSDTAARCRHAHASPQIACRIRKSGGAIDGLLSILDLEPLEENLFRGRSPQQGWQRVFGGQVLGQALVAAVRTVPAERIAHSLHAYFLLPGDPSRPIIYNVERVRDGGSFTTRRVTAIQHGRAMFVMSVSFHIAEPGLDHQDAMPKVPPPEDLPSEQQLKAKLLAQLPENMRSYWERERPIEMRPVDVSRYFARREGRARAVPSGCGPAGGCPTPSRCISACWPTPPTSRCSTRP